MTEGIVGGEFTSRKVAELKLDWRNPRLPVSLNRSDASQDELALYIDKHHGAARVAKSIENHGFFVSEPLIAVPEGDGTYVVVEGNRRLVALKGLTDPDLRQKLEGQTKAWSRLGDFPADADIPVVIVELRSQVDSLLGFRHISGIEPWDPYAQARFVADLVEKNESFEVTAERVGRSVTEVRSMYRDQDILNQARQEFDLDTSRAESAFGVFNAAMGIVNLRSYISAPAPRDVDISYYPLPDDAKAATRRLLTYLFGDARGRNRVITDSRQLRKLGSVLSDPSGQAERELRTSGDLDAAIEAAASNEDGARRDLRRAIRALQSASDRVGRNGFELATLSEMVAECSDLLEGIRGDIERG